MVTVALLSSLISYPLTRKTSKPASFIILVIVNTTLVSAAGMLLTAFFYSAFYPLRIYYALSALSVILFLPLISEEDLSFKESFIERVKVVLLYALVVIITALLREVVGSGTVFGHRLFDALIPTLSRPTGAFFTYGVTLGLVNAFYNKKEEVK